MGATLADWPVLGTTKAPGIYLALRLLARPAARPALLGLSRGLSSGLLRRMHELPHTRGCFVCGESNPIGLRLRFHTDGTIVRTEFVPGPEHVGFQEVVHGGIISTVLDEVMVWACAVATKQFGYCAELTVRFQQPLRPGRTAVATAELVANRKQRILEARARLAEPDGTVLALATGKYLPLKAEDTERFFPDLIGDWKMLKPE
jgi:acyl-coenzyme A thioesterase PaaI-like protein